jgi:hypothetical protein
MPLHYSYVGVVSVVVISYFRLTNYNIMSRHAVFEVNDVLENILCFLSAVDTLKCSGSFSGFRKASDNRFVWDNKRLYLKSSHSLRNVVSFMPYLSVLHLNLLEDNNPLLPLSILQTHGVQQEHQNVGLGNLVRQCSAEHFINIPQTIALNKLADIKYLNTLVLSGIDFRTTIPPYLFRLQQLQFLEISNCRGLDMDATQHRISIPQSVKTLVLTENDVFMYNILGLPAISMPYSMQEYQQLVFDIEKFSLQSLVAHNEMKRLNERNLDLSVLAIYIRHLPCLTALRLVCQTDAVNRSARHITNGVSMPIPMSVSSSTERGLKWIEFGFGGLLQPACTALESCRNSLTSLALHDDMNSSHQTLAEKLPPVLSLLTHLERLSIRKIPVYSTSFISALNGLEQLKTMIIVKGTHGDSNIDNFSFTPVYSKIERIVWFPAANRDRYTELELLYILRFPRLKKLYIICPATLTVSTKIKHTILTECALRSDLQVWFDKNYFSKSGRFPDKEMACWPQPDVEFVFETLSHPAAADTSM